jgi:hypothetical protein
MCFSPVLLVAWIAQVGSWAVCELTSGFLHVQGFCYQSWVNGPRNYNAGKTLVEVVFGIACAMLYVLVVPVMIDCDDFTLTLE